MCQTPKTPIDKSYRRFERAQRLEAAGHYLEASMAYELAGATQNAAHTRDLARSSVLARRRNLPTRP